MIRTEHYKGKLRKVERLENETLEEQCKRVLDSQGESDPLEEGSYDSYLEKLTYYHEFVLCNGELYGVISMEERDPDGEIFTMTEKENGDLDFEVRYYNGGYGFNEAIERAYEKNRKGEL